MSEKSKNEMISRMIQKHVKFGYRGADSWCGSVENMSCIQKKKKAFIFEINDNRLAAINEHERNKGHFIRTDRMEMPEEEPVPV